MSAWADRKAAVKEEAEAIKGAEHAAVVAEQHAALAEKPEAEVLAELDLPNPDTMESGDDFSAFMKETVPSALRNRALRTLWRSDPALANVDMLVDYGDDFTGKNDPVGLIKTIYQVGKGMVTEETEEEVEVEDETVVTKVAEETAEVAEFEATEAAPLPEPEILAAALLPRRRMRFEFEASTLPASTEMETQ